MPNKNSPPKHRTPQYKLVPHPYVTTNIWGDIVKMTISLWEPQPLRAGRKDA